MRKKNNPRKVVRHVSFTCEEDAALREAAEKASMELVPYIRQMALLGSVKTFNWEALNAHSEIISSMILEVNLFMDNYVYGDVTAKPDLIRLIRVLEDILMVERDVYQFLLSNPED